MNTSFLNPQQKRALELFRKEEAHELTIPELTESAPQGTGTLGETEVLISFFHYWNLISASRALILPSELPKCCLRHGFQVWTIIAHGRRYCNLLSGQKLELEERDVYALADPKRGLTGEEFAALLAKCRDDILESRGMFAGEYGEMVSILLFAYQYAHTADSHNLKDIMRRWRQRARSVI